MSIDYSGMAFPKPQKSPKKKKRIVVNKSTYEKVYEACGGKCVLCNSTTWLELHHIDGRGKVLTNEKENCVMLCRKCHHDIVHMNLKKYRPILKEIASKIYIQKR